MLLMQLLVNGMFSHYDRPQIVQLYEKIHLYMQAFQHYKKLDDIEHVVINIHVIEPQASVEIFKSMGWELAMDISRHL